MYIISDAKHIKSRKEKVNMQFTKSELWDMLSFSNEELRGLNENLYMRKIALLDELSNRIAENNHIEIEFVSAES